MQRTLVSYALWVLLAGFVASMQAAEATSEDAKAVVRQEEAFRRSADKRPANWLVSTAGEFGVIFNRKADGIELLSLFDLAKHRQLLAEKPVPMFVITMRNAESKEELRLQADGGWQQVRAAVDPLKGIELGWQSPNDKRLGELRVSAVGAIDAAAGAIRWKLSVDGVGKTWSVRRAAFPQIALDATSPAFEFFYPRGSGMVKHVTTNSPISFGGNYPNGWTTMQFMAGYDAQVGTGLYCGMHDPLACTKDIFGECRPDPKTVEIRFEVPAENMDVGGNSYSSPGESVWQLLRGDWYDAAMIYRGWVRQNASWYPKLGPEGRTDTPAWMRELSVWLQTGGEPKTVVPAVEAFAKAIGVPVGFHWYCWHQTPFDNDYPHYFPVRDGFGEAVRDLQSKAVYVMPYINGRLWDTRDKGNQDFEFTRVALPAVTKDEAGKPYIESYGSKEADGSPVKLGVMCPTTALWQAKVRENVLRLMNEYGVKGVYIDQVAAAPPVLCFDHSHGHPTGGGHWWVESYNAMLAAIRQAKPTDRMLTTECNAEPFVKSFDGYLTWHWGYDGQVPAFPAVYGGAVQMFGRAYRGNDPLSFCMRAGQQFVFGEQIGWFGPEVIQNQEQAAYLKQVVGLRHQFRRYFHAGEMARPPKLQGTIPTVRADWMWDNPGWVTTDVVMTGAWISPNEHRCLLLFTNVGDKPITAKLHLDGAAYGLSGAQIKVTAFSSAGPGDSFQSPLVLDRDVTIPPRSAMAWEATPAGK